MRPLLVALGVGFVLAATHYFSYNVAQAEAVVRRRRMYGKTGSFVPPVALPDAPQDVRQRKPLTALPNPSGSQGADHLFGLGCVPHRELLVTCMFSCIPSPAAISDCIVGIISHPDRQALAVDGPSFLHPAKLSAC